MAEKKEKAQVKVNASIMWCFHNKINTLADKYTIDFYGLSEGAVEALEEMGIDVKHESLDDAYKKAKKRDPKVQKDSLVPREFYITCKSKNSIRVVDDAQNDLSEEAIGNGSVCTVTIGWYDWTNPSGKKGRSPSARRVVISDLVPYEGSSVDDDDEPAL